jgi:hypothetical protein
MDKALRDTLLRVCAVPDAWLYDATCRVNAFAALGDGQCGKTLADCRNKFDNVARFTGFPSEPPSVDWFDQPFDFTSAKTISIA